MSDFPDMTDDREPVLPDSDGPLDPLPLEF